MSILVKAYVENTQGEIVPFELITSEKQLNINRTLWEYGYNPEEEEDFYCPVFPGAINFEINGKVFWKKKTSLCHEVSMLWMHFRGVSYAAYQSSFEGKSTRWEVGGGHGCETIFISTSESHPKFLDIEEDKKYGDSKEEVGGDQFIVSVLIEATSFYEKLDTLFPKPDSSIKEDLLKAKSALQELQKAQDNLLHD